MKYLPFIWANLRRNLIRTVFTFASVVFAFTLLGLVLGFDASLRQIAASAHADRIYTSATFGGALHLAQMDQISQFAAVSAVGALGAIQGYYQRPGNNVSLMMVGPGMQRVFPELLPTIQHWQRLAKARDGVFISRMLALRQGWKAGTHIPVIAAMTRRADGSDVWTFDVLGIVPDIPHLPVGFAVGNYDYLDQARAAADRAQVMQFWSLARDAAHTDAVTHDIDRWFASSAQPTNSVSEKALLGSAAGSGGDAVLVLKALAILGIGMIMYLTTNALRHSIRERTTELAILKTLGFRNARIAALIILEVALPCVSGSVAGLGVAATLATVMPWILPARTILPAPTIGFEVVALGIGAAFLVAVVAALIPALRISRLDVATALARH